MARIIEYAFDTPWAIKDADDRGTIEMPDGATDEECEEAVRELFWERYNYGWSDAEDSTHG